MVAAIGLPSGRGAATKSAAVEEVAAGTDDEDGLCGVVHKGSFRGRSRSMKGEKGWRKNFSNHVFPNWKKRSNSRIGASMQTLKGKAAEIGAGLGRRWRFHAKYLKSGQERHCALSQRPRVTNINSRNVMFRQVKHNFEFGHANIGFSSRWSINSLGISTARPESLLLEAQSSSDWYCSRLEMFPSHTVFCGVTIATTFGTSQGPRHPLILN
jgi:hypothetical protein